MIMFRKKIDPKTVVTVQNALPRIVVALLLITFSYAIVGIMIDLMYVFLALIIQLLNSAAPDVFKTDVLTKYTTSGFGAVRYSLWGGFASYQELIKFISPNDPSKNAWTLFANAFIITSGNALLWFVLAIAYLFASVRIFFMLLSAYVQIIVALLTSPLHLLIVAVPGSKTFESWIKNLLTNIVVFPITAILLMISVILANSQTKLWTPPLLGVGGSGIAAILGLGLALTIPSIVGSIKEALKAKPVINVGLGAALGPMGAGVGQAMQLGYQASFVGSQFLHKNQESTPGQRLTKAAKEGIKGSP
jgi:hypothetical protein